VRKPDSVPAYHGEAPAFLLFLTLVAELQAIWRSLSGCHSTILTSEMAQEDLYPINEIAKISGKL
jgi:hypothetical protein